MKKFPRRSFLAGLGSIPLLFSMGWAKRAEALTHGFFSNSSRGNNRNLKPGATRSALDITNSTRFAPGYLSILQGPTSDQEALFNVFAPRLKNYSYVVLDSTGAKCVCNKYSTVTGPGFYNVDKVKASGLSLGANYTLQVIDGKTIVDERTFSTLDVRKANPNFALISCMPDDYRFNDVIDPMWERLQAEKPDFIILNGDTVYVDSFEFVQRQKATEFDLWQRYTDACKRIPLYHWTTLTPVFTTWDDHDFGTNDGDTNFAMKAEAGRLFHAFFGGDALPGVWSQGPQGISSSLTAFGQRFFFMDDRTFRQPNKSTIAPTDPYGHWGQDQHEWLIKNLESSSDPAWIINGNQCFSGVTLSYKQNFEDNHTKEFTALVSQLSKIKAPVVFASGDVHLSEIQAIPKTLTGYDTYEFTSSSMHSYTGTGWANPARVNGTLCIEFNFMMIQSRNENGALKIDVKCVGLPVDPYFTQSFTVQT